MIIIGCCTEKLFAIFWEKIYKEDMIDNYRYAEEGPDAETRRNATVPFELRIDVQIGGCMRGKSHTLLIEN